MHGNRRVALGTYNFTGDMGKFLFPAIAAVVLSVVSWRTLCFGYGMLGMIMVVGLYVLLRSLQAGAIDIQTYAERGKRSTWGIENKKAFFTLSAIGFIDTAVRSTLITFLPLLGIALNGTSSVLYGTVTDFVSATHVPRVFGLFYTAIILAAAVAPPVFGLLSDALGVAMTIVIVGLTALLTLPLAGMLSKEMHTRINHCQKCRWPEPYIPPSPCI